MKNKILKIYGKQKVYFVTIQDKNRSVVNLLIEADSSYRLRPTLNANGFPKGKVGTKYKVHLPEKYSDTPGKPVDAVIVDIPFKESFNANTREVSKG